MRGECDACVVCMGTWMHACVGELLAFVQPRLEIASKYLRACEGGGECSHARKRERIHAS